VTSPVIIAGAVNFFASSGFFVRLQGSPPQAQRSASIPFCDTSQKTATQFRLRLWSTTIMPLSFRLFLVSGALLFSLTSAQAQTASANNLPPPKKSSPGIFGLGFNHDGRIIATGNFNGTVKLWDVPSGRLLRTLDGHTDVVYKGVFSPDEKILASCSRDGKIKIWEV
jgi:WD40 repeat protein